MKTLRIWALAALLMLAVACTAQPGGQPATATVAPTLEPAAPPTETPAPGGLPLGEVITGTATVENVDLLILESFPVQVNAHVQGWLGDGCTELAPYEVVREGNTFRLTLTTTRPAEAVCTLQLIELDETIALDVAGLPKGTYTVDVNGVTETFELAVDNVLKP